MERQDRHRDDINVAFNGRDDFFRDIFNSVLTGLLIIDPETHIILDINPAAEALIGDTRRNVVGSICHKFICPAEQGHCPITDLHQTVDRSERVLLTRDGRKVPVIKSVGFISIAGGRFLLENIIDNSEYKRTEAVARDNERKIRAVFDQTFQFIGIMTPDGILTEANRSALKFSGVDERDVIGKPFWDTTWWSHSAELQAKLKEAVKQSAQGELIRFEATHKAPDGSLHYVDFSLKPVMDENGEVIYLIPEGRDITDRKKIEDELRQKNEDLYAAYEQLTATEEELRQNYDELAKNEKALAESNRKIRAIFDQTYQFIGIMTTDGILTEANRSALKFSGVDEQDVLGKPFWDTPWWAHSEELRNRLKESVALAAHGEFVRFEATHKAPDGSLHYVDFSLKPVMDENGTVIYLIPEGRDITDRKKIEDELRLKNEDLFAAYEQLTATEEELRQNYDELAKKEQELGESETIYRAIFGNTGTAMALIEEDTRIRLVNTEFEEMSGYTRSEVEGTMTWTQFVVREDLERMQAQHRLRRSDTGSALTHYEFRLITKSGEIRDIYLTIDLIPGTKKSVASLMDITESNRMTERLKASLEEKEVLLREIHHRVKNNLQIIISLLNLQCRNIRDRNVLEAIKECQNRVRAMALVHEKVYQSVHISDIDFKDYIRFLAQYLFEFYQIDKRLVNFALEGEPIKVSINRAVPLGLIVNELISNSLKHAFPPGTSGTIRIRTDTHPDHFAIRIADNGIGIPEGIDPENAEKLGLMLVKSLADQLHADLSLDRRDGTMFTITIPFDPAV
jgi:PAS domain S-box-containing protein